MVSSAILGPQATCCYFCCPPSVRWSWGICRASDLRRPREEVGQRLTATIQLQTASPSLHPVEVGGEIGVLSLTFFLFPNSLYCPILFRFTRQRRSWALRSAGFHWHPISIPTPTLGNWRSEGMVSLKKKIGPSMQVGVSNESL